MVGAGALSGVAVVNRKPAPVPPLPRPKPGEDLFQANRHLLAFAHDIVMTGVALFLAYYLRLGDAFFRSYYFDGFALSAGLLLLVAGGSFLFMGLYRGIWAYASTRDLVQIAKAVTLAVAGFTIAVFMVNRLGTMPRSVPIILWFVLIMLLGGPRFLYRVVRDRRIVRREAGATAWRQRVLVVGANDTAAVMIRALIGTPTSRFEPVGLIDEKGRRVGRSMHGVPVLGALDDLEEVLQRLTRDGRAPQRLVLTRPPAQYDGEALRRLMAVAEAGGLTLSQAPDPNDLRSAVDDGPTMLRPIAVEDLLGRPQATLDHSAIAALVAGRRVLVTGAGGTIGGELSRQIARLGPYRLTLVDNGEYNLYAIDNEVRRLDAALDLRCTLLDVRDAVAVGRLLDAEAPEIVFHAAAIKHVPIAEAQPCEAVATNILGTRNVADAAARAGARAFVLISTDKAIRPTSVMGATKRVAEAYCQALDLHTLSEGAGPTTRFMTVRFGNVLGSSGSVVPLFRRQLAEGGPLTVTHPDMRRYFMTVREAVQLVLQASAHGLAHPDEAGRVFVLDMGEPVKIVDLARQMILLAGLSPDHDVRIAFTGLRPGEKLFEELLDPAEAPEATRAAGVFVATPQTVHLALLERVIATLAQAVRDGDDDRVVAMLAQLVPGYARPAKPKATAEESRDESRSE
ncbi:MAG: polysaccharide biosynthesis protein [Alphaproteobacteria bacterium]|jgi:O-antigen biosynthesis protein WbqV|nr:polysaccharide biosynthesis protein [Alphaproteobacteria bacterium]